MRAKCKSCGYIWTIKKFHVKRRRCKRCGSKVILLEIGWVPPPPSEWDKLGYKDLDLAAFWVKTATRYPYLNWLRAMATERKKVEEGLEKLKEDILAEKEVPTIHSFDHFLEIVNARKNIYEIIAFYLTKISEEHVKIVLSGELVSSLTRSLELVYAGLDKKGDIAEGLRDLVKFSNRCKGKNLEELTRWINEEQTSIFYDISLPTVQPYESVYRGEHQVWGESTEEIIYMYEEAGFKIPPQSTELADHISYELKFMSHLCDRSLSDRDRMPTYFDKQAEFLKKHTVWMCLACEDIKTTANEKDLSSLFPGLAKILKSFISSEIRRIDHYREFVRANCKS